MTGKTAYMISISLYVFVFINSLCIVIKIKN